MKIKCRQDLLFFQRQDQTEASWVIKDPLSFEHYLFTQREFFLLQQLNGVRTEEDIVRRWQRRFRTHSLSVQQLRVFVRKLIQDNLVIVDLPGIGGALDRQQDFLTRLSRRSRWTNPLAIRFRGVNPSPILNCLSGLRWLFEPWAVATMLLLSSTVLIYMFGHFDDVTARIPAINQLIAGQSIVGLIGTLIVVKILHELGHALACRHFGGECFEIGVILLALIPTLYCNVSDAWIIQQRWKRMMVSFAGIYVEIVLATLAAIVWLLTPPSLLNAMMFNIVLLCSVNTVLVNGNPLLRYDGYYLLADAWEKPNLSALSSRAWVDCFLSWFLVPRSRISMPNSVLIYGFLSFCYRWFVVIAILAGFVWIIGEAGSYPLGYMISGTLLIGFLANSARQTWRFTRANQWKGVAKTRLIFTLTIFALTAWGLFFIPLPCSVPCGVIVEAANPLRVFAPADGQLIEVASSGTAVEQGQVVAKLKNETVQWSLQFKSNEARYQQGKLNELQRRVNGEPELVSRIKIAEEKLKSLEHQKEILAKELASFLVPSPIDGTVFPAASQAADGSQVQPRKWSGFVNEEQNLGCYVSRGEHLLTIADASQYAVSLIVSESEMDFIELGQKVRVRFEQAPDQTAVGTVTRILKQEMLIAQSSLSPGESIVDAEGNRRLLQTPYRVEVGDIPVPPSVQFGSSGQARISVRYQTVGERLMRLVERSLATRR